MKRPVRSADWPAVSVGALERCMAKPDADLESGMGGSAADRAPAGSSDVGRDRCRRRAVQALVAAYAGDVHRLLADVARRLAVSLACVDRAIIEAHLERDLSEREWAAFSGRLTAMAFDEHVGDHGTFRTDWIEDRLAEAGVPGRRPTTGGKPAELPGAGHSGTHGVVVAGPCGEARHRRP